MTVRAVQQHSAVKMEAHSTSEDPAFDVAALAYKIVLRI
jgi:hypothetical protein